MIGFDRIKDKADIAKLHGVGEAASAASVAKQADIVHICVMTKDDLEAAVFGPDGIGIQGTPDKVLIDHSTTPVESTRMLAERLRTETGMAWIDAPVSGGPPAAAAGTLAIMAGGDPDVFQRVLPLLAHLGQTTHMGPIGAGQATKMVNPGHRAEQFLHPRRGVGAGPKPAVSRRTKIPAALGQGYAGSNMLEKLFPRMIDRDFAPAGYLFQCMKDLDMVQDFARGLKVPTPMSGQAASLFRLMMSKGHGNLDAIAVLKLFDQDEEGDTN